MFFNSKQPVPSPVTEPESDGLEIKIRLSGPTIVKLLSIAIAVLFGSGVLVHTTSAKKPLVDTPVETMELAP